MVKIIVGRHPAFVQPGFSMAGDRQDSRARKAWIFINMRFILPRQGLSPAVDIE
jgi:hypothetical protein